MTPSNKKIINLNSYVNTMQKRESLFVSIVVVISIITISIGPLSSNIAADDEIRWHSYGSGVEIAQRDDKPVFIDFMTEWCGTCERMEEETYPDDRVKERGDHIVFIKVDVDERNDLAQEYDIHSVPTLVFEDPRGEEIDREVGFLSAEELVEKLDNIIDEDDVKEDENEGEIPFWRHPIFLNIVVSSVVAVGIVIFLKNKKENS